MVPTETSKLTRLILWVPVGVSRAASKRWRTPLVASPLCGLPARHPTVLRGTTTRRERGFAGKTNRRLYSHGPIVFELPQMGGICGALSNPESARRLKLTRISLGQGTNFT